MPIYEYECEECGYVFEIFRGISSDDKNIECPMCGETHSKRIYSTFNSANKSNCAPRFSGG